jgi:hypothetical protein
LRKKYGGEGVSDEEIILRFFSSKEDVDKMHAAGPARTYAGNSGNPLLNLVGELSKQKDRGTVYIQRPGFSLRLERRSASLIKYNNQLSRAQESQSASLATALPVYSGKRIIGRYPE